MEKPFSKQEANKRLAQNIGAILWEG